MSPKGRGNLFLSLLVLEFLLFIFLISNLLRGQQELVGITQTVTGGLALFFSIIILFLEIPRKSPSQIFHLFMYNRKLHIAIGVSTTILAILIVFTALLSLQQQSQTQTVLSPSSAQVVSSPPSFEPQPAVIVGQMGIRVRLLPSVVVGKHIDTLQAGDKVIVTGQTRDQDNVPWYRIDVPDRYQNVWIVAFVEFQGVIYVPVRLDEGVPLKQPMIPYEEAKKK